MRGAEVEAATVVVADQPAILLSLLLLSGGVPPPSGQHAGTAWYTLPLERGRQSAYLAATDRYLLAASTAAGLTALIDRAGGSGSTGALAASPRYRDATSRLPANRVATVYLDGAGLTRLIETASAPPLGGEPPR